MKPDVIVVKFFASLKIIMNNEKQSIIIIVIIVRIWQKLWVMLFDWYCIINCCIKMSSVMFATTSTTPMTTSTTLTTSRI